MSNLKLSFPVIMQIHRLFASCFGEITDAYFSESVGDVYGVACGFLKELTVDGIWDAHNAFTLLCIEVFLDRTLIDLYNKLLQLLILVICLIYASYSIKPDAALLYRASVDLY